MEGWHSLGQVDRDLIGGRLRRAQNWSVHLYRSNPLAKRVIQLYTSYIAGEGFGVGARNPEVEACVIEAWTAHRNQIERHHRGYARDWLLFGELFPPVSVDAAGNMTIGFIDPTTVKSVERDRGNNMVLNRVHVQAGLAEPDVVLEVVRPSLEVGPMLGLLEGQVHVWLYDRIGASTRGTPMLLPVVDWIDAYDQVLWEGLERMKAMRAHYWDVTVEGGQGEVDKIETRWGHAAPRSGSTRFHTGAVKVEAVAPQLGGYEDVTSARFLLRHISAGAGVAPHMLADPEDSNRSTAERMAQPVLKGIIDVQAEWRRNTEELLRHVVDQKVAAGRLDAVVQEFDSRGNPRLDSAGAPIMTPAHDTITITVPDADSSEIKEQAEALGLLATALVTLRADDLIDPTTARRTVESLLPAFGVPLDEIPDLVDDGRDSQLQGAIVEALGAL